MFQTKEQIITEYFSNIDFKGDWNYKKIQMDLKSLIGEEPAIDIKWKKDAVLNEFNSEVSEVSVIDSIDVIYSPNLDKRFVKKSFKIGT